MIINRKISNPRLKLYYLILTILICIEVCIKTLELIKCPFFAIVIDLLDLLIPAIIAVIISKHFYDKANHNAFCNDIVMPISKLEESDEIINKIKECEKSFLYQYTTKEEKKVIEDLYSASKGIQENNYEHTFKEAIMKYFYKTYRREREHLRFINEINDYVIEPNYDESMLDIEGFSNYFINEDNYDKNKQDELSELLYDFYKSIGGEKDNIIFKDKNVNEIFYESNEYKLYENARDNFEKAKTKLRQLKSCK